VGHGCGSAPALCGASLSSIAFEAGKNGRRPGAEHFPER
jgi:hypothetical protein